MGSLKSPFAWIPESSMAERRAVSSEFLFCSSTMTELRKSTWPWADTASSFNLVYTSSSVKRYAAECFHVLDKIETMDRTLFDLKKQIFRICGQKEFAQKSNLGPILKLSTNSQKVFRLCIWKFQLLHIVCMSLCA